jgi:cephalosporin hydroxylase
LAVPLSETPGFFDGYNTDKGWHHSYGPMYEEWLTPRRNGVKAVLELGVLYGGSLRKWRDYFPSAQVVGLDIDHVTMVHGEKRILTVEGNVADSKVLSTLRDMYEWDMIVDDASHLTIHQFQALKYLWPSLRDGGLYFIEDLDLHKRPELLTMFHLIVRGEARVELHLGKRGIADDVLILEKEL